MLACWTCLIMHQSSQKETEEEQNPNCFSKEKAALPKKRLKPMPKASSDTESELDAPPQKRKRQTDSDFNQDFSSFVSRFSTSPPYLFSLSPQTSVFFNSPFHTPTSFFLASPRSLARSSAALDPPQPRLIQYAHEYVPRGPFRRGRKRG